MVWIRRDLVSLQTSESTFEARAQSDGGRTSTPSSAVLSRPDDIPSPGPWPSSTRLGLASPQIRMLLVFERSSGLSLIYGHEVGPCKTDTCYHHKDFSADTNLMTDCFFENGVDVRPVGAGAPTRTAQHGRFHESLRARARGP